MTRRDPEGVAEGEAEGLGVGVAELPFPEDIREFALLEGDA